MMVRSEQEKAANRAAFRALSPAAKAEHIWIYYKWFLILGAAALVIAGSVAYRLLTRKDPVLYLGLVNVSLGSQAETRLTEDFLAQAGRDPERETVQLYRELFLSEEAVAEAHKMAYASGIKIMAAIESRQLDAVLMSRQAYDILSSRGYLLDLKQALASDPALKETLLDCLCENDVIAEDNFIEYQLSEAEQREQVIRQERNALRVDELPCFAAEGYTEPMYLGLIANTPRLDLCLDWLRFLQTP